MSGLIHVDDVLAAEVMLPVLVHDVVPERFNLLFVVCWQLLGKCGSLMNYFFTIFLTCDQPIKCS